MSGRTLAGTRYSFSSGRKKGKKSLHSSRFPDSFDALEENVDLRARTPNISILPLAVGNPASASDTVLIKVPGGDFGQASPRFRSHRVMEGERDVVGVLRLGDEPGYGSYGPTATANRFREDRQGGGELNASQGGGAHVARSTGPLLYCEVYEEVGGFFGYTPAELLGFVRSLEYTSARVISKGAYPLRLDEAAPAGWFDTSSDVLFFTGEHTELVKRFDRRFS